MFQVNFAHSNSTCSHSTIYDWKINVETATEGAYSIFYYDMKGSASSTSKKNNCVIGDETGTAKNYTKGTTISTSSDGKKSGD